MKYNQLIKGSPAVSEIGLGAWQLGIRSGWKELTEAEAITLVQTALEMGVNFFDTAPNYGRGTSELRLGKALQGYDRSKLVINTKFGHTDTGVTNFDSSNIRSSLEGSLKRLQTDYVDSLIIHSPPSVYLDGNNNDHYEVLEQLKTEGKIKAYGASLDTYADIETLLRTTQSQVIEVFFNILHQDTARAFEPAKAKGVGIIVKIPLDSGWLTGRYDEHSFFTDIRKRWSANDIRTRAVLIQQVKSIIGPEANLATTALSFCLAYDAVSTIIPGNTSLQQLTENLTACSIPLSGELVKQLETFYEQEVRGLHIPW